MRTIETVQMSGPDKLLRLTVPVDEPGRTYRVVLVIVKEAGTAETGGWPPGFFEATAGSIQDDSFVRPEQGEYEKRLDLE